MKNFLFLLIFISTALSAQMPNIAKVWLNNSRPYVGTIGNSNEGIKVRIALSERDRKNDQEYFLSGFSLVENNSTKFEGKLKITQYKDGKKRSSVYGEYELAEEPSGKHSGIFKGKFVYTFMWNKKTQEIEKQYIAFIGNWTSYDKTLTYKTTWRN